MIQCAPKICIPNHENHLPQTLGSSSAWRATYTTTDSRVALAHRDNAISHKPSSKEISPTEICYEFRSLVVQYGTRVLLFTANETDIEIWPVMISDRVVGLHQDMHMCNFFLGSGGGALCWTVLAVCKLV